MNNSQILPQVKVIQESIAVKNQEIHHIREAIAKQKQVLTDIFGDFGISSLESKREELAASIALNNASPDELKKLDSDISSLKNRLSESQSVKDQTIAALNGLSRLAEQANAQIMQLTSDLKTVHLQFYREQANQEQIHYLSLADTLKNPFFA